MAEERSSGFFFNVEKWDASKAVQRMSFSEQGVYFAMLRQQWRTRFLPDDAQQVADEVAINEAQVAEVLKAWAVVRPKFVVAEKGPKRIYNVALERTRRKQRASERKRAESGRIAGKASAAKRAAIKTLAVNDRSTDVQRPSTEKNRSDQTRSEEKSLVLTKADEQAYLKRMAHDIESAHQQRSRKRFR